MAAETPPIFLQAGSHDAEHTRRALASIVGNRPGIVGAGDLVVTQKSGTPNMSVDVAEGQVIVAGDEATYQGVYLCEARGVTNLVIAAADATNPRRDLIIARVRDSAYSGATDTFSIEVVQGTPAGSPSDPSLPTGSVYVLARVAVAAGATSISNANITDGRAGWSGQFGRAAALGGTIICTSTTRPSSPFEGMRIYETDTNREYVHSGTAWVVPYPLGRLASATLTADVTGITAVVYPLSVVATILANRRIRVTVTTNVSINNTGTTAVGIADNSGTIAAQNYLIQNTTNSAEHIAAEWVHTSGVGGSTTYKMSVFSSQISAVRAAVTSPTVMTIIDEGPS